MSGLLALDWGTSSLRGALLDGEGRVVEERAFPRGILSVAAGGFPAVFEELFGDWAGEMPLTLVSGMAGSKQGWVEAPYCACPAGFGDIARHLQWITPGKLAIVPGLSCEKDGVPDVMRGEEVQVFGALQLLDLEEATLVLPGTHSKWVRARHGRIEAFSSFMTGEFYALLRQHSILARTLPAEDGALDEAAFSRGVAHALHSESLLNTAFSARTLSLFDRLPAAAMPSYLSGLVIGEELRAQALEARHDGSREVVVMGSDALTRRYELALSQRHVAVRKAGSEATWHGLWALAQTLQQPD